MRVPISLLLVLLVLAEIAVFIQVGEAIGIGSTLALVLLSLIAGVVLLRRQGVTALMRIRAEAASGRIPAKPLFEGAIAAVAAALMIVPGFLTDVVGLLLFIPAVRDRLWQRLRRNVEARIVRHDRLRPARPSVIELEATELAAAPKPDSPWRRDGGRGG